MNDNNMKDLQHSKAQNKVNTKNARNERLYLNNSMTNKKFDHNQPTQIKRNQQHKTPGPVSRQKAHKKNQLQVVWEDAKEATQEEYRTNLKDLINPISSQRLSGMASSKLAESSQRTILKGPSIEIINIKKHRYDTKDDYE
uniref:Uncharacterized protein n=1 Tax=Euplotes harpa TaxID=151035 RepID=A0A7S3JKW8_9SPIT|mmetsp:Transcript_42169/g.48956  ORF Transcript_42169/g.48956 Transcript_42169/m.48956 type:complete len:141 (+) Transcript_42169:263-685(+)